MASELNIRRLRQSHGRRRRDPARVSHRGASPGHVRSASRLQRNGGFNPACPVIQAGDGNFYGTTGSGGVSNGGTVFKLTSLRQVSPRSALPSTAAPATRSGAGAGSRQTTATCTARPRPAARPTGDPCSRSLSPAPSPCCCASSTAARRAARPGVASSRAATANCTAPPRRAARVAAAPSSRSSTAASSPPCVRSIATPRPAIPLPASSRPAMATSTARCRGGRGRWGDRVQDHTERCLTTLHSFDCGGNDGCVPLATLIQAGDGNLYGTTNSRGAASGGTVFRISLARAFTSGTLRLRHRGLRTRSRPHSGQRRRLLRHDPRWRDGGGGTVLNMTLAGDVTVTTSTPSMQHEGCQPLSSSSGRSTPTSTARLYLAAGAITAPSSRWTAEGAVTTVIAFGCGVDGCGPAGGLIQVSGDFDARPSSAGRPRGAPSSRSRRPATSPRGHS